MDYFSRITVGACDPSGVEDLKRHGIEVVIYDVRNCQELVKHFRGHDVIYIIPPNCNDMLEAVKKMIDATKEAGVKCALLWSVMGAEHHESRSIAGGKKWMQKFMEMEKHFKQSKIEHHCIMRTSIYMQTFLLYSRYVQENGEMPLPVQKGKFAPISLRDVTCFTVCLLSAKHGNEGERGSESRDPSRPYVLPEEHRGKCYLLTGCELVTAPEAVERASDAIGAEIGYKQVDIREAKEILKQAGKMEEVEIDVLLETYQLIEEGKYENVSHDFEKVVRKKPLKLEEFFEDHAKEFQPRN